MLVVETVAVGASSIETTLIFAVLSFELNAVVPPVAAIFTLVPASLAVELPVIDRWSQARNLKAPPPANVPGSPKKFGSGRKRSLSVSSRRRDCVADTTTASKAPPSCENSRVPLDTDAAVMAMASTGVSSSSNPGFTASFASVMELSAMRAAIVVPVLETRGLSSSTLRTGVMFSRTGASFCDVTVIENALGKSVSSSLGGGEPGPLSSRFTSKTTGPPPPVLASGASVNVKSPELPSMAG